MDSNSTWREAALHDLEFTGLSYQEIGDKYGRSRATIIKLQQRYDLKRQVPVERRTMKKLSEMKSISQEHRSLGSRLTVFRSNKLLTEVGEKLGVSRHIVKLMEIGAHDFTLTELNRIAQLLDCSIHDLIAPITLSAPTPPKHGKGRDAR